MAVAIVTGNRRELARDLAARGYAVVVVYLHHQAPAEALVAEILTAGGSAVTLRADLTDELDVERVFDETIAAFGPVDLVVHAAPCDPAVVVAHAARRLS